MRMSVSSRDGRNACAEGVGCRVWRGVEPPHVEDYPIPCGDESCLGSEPGILGFSHEMENPGF